MDVLKFHQTNLKVLHAQIEKLPVDAIVCPSESPCPAEAVTQKIIVVPVANASGKTSETLLRQACQKAFARAEELKVSALAIPPLGAEVDGFPAIGSAKILAQETLKHLRACKETLLREIVFCLPSEELKEIFEKNLIGYVRHIEEDLGQGPYVTVDCIIELPGGFVVIERSNPPYGWALPGGFVDRGESLETAVRREMKEETGLKLSGLKLFGVYSYPGRDPRFHTISVIYTAQGVGRAKAGDDAQGLRVVARKELLKLKYAFDHKKILTDYLKKRKK